jgi:hypothetical protein
MSATTSSAFHRAVWRARGALVMISVLATLVGCSTSSNSPENQQYAPTSQVEPDENEPDEAEPDENERNENERDENERDENEPDENEQGEDEGGNDD